MSIANMNWLGVLGQKLAGFKSWVIVEKSILEKGLLMERGRLGKVV